MLTLAFPPFATDTGHDHRFHALIVEGDCLILSSNKRERYQVDDIEFDHDVGVFSVVD
jgi:hypothetical protein